MKLRINGVDRQLQDSLTLGELVEQLEMKPDRVAVERNGEIVRREQWAATSLADGDRLEIVHFVGGGCGAGRRSRPAASPEDAEVRVPSRNLPQSALVLG